MTETGSASSGRQDGEYIVRTYRHGDEAELAQFYREVYGRERNVDQRRWKLLGRGSAIEGIWLAEERGSGRIAAQYCGIPIQFVLGGELREAVESFEAMTAPDHRRKGLFTALMTAAHRSWQLAGRSIVVGLPNDQWGTRTRALGWQPLFPLAWLRFPLRVDRVVSRSDGRSLPAAGMLRAGARLASATWRGLHLSGKPSVEYDLVDLPGGEIPRVAHQLDALWLETGGAYANCFVRDADWLRWRFAAESGFNYRMITASRGGVPAGYLVYRSAEAKGRTTGYIADMFARPDDTATVRTLVTSALQKLDEAGAATVAATAPPGSGLFAMLRNLGFMLRKASFSVEAVLLDESIQVEQLRDPRAWHLTAGDFDVI